MPQVMESKRNSIALIGAVGAGVASIWMLRRALRQQGKNEIPTLRLPPGYYHALQVLFGLGKDNFQYGTGRWILQSCDPDIGICKAHILGQSFVMLRDPALV